MVSKRRRYDTVELVTELKRERRNAFLLSLAGIGILVILLLLYVTAIGDDEVPTVPDDNISDTVPTVDSDPLTVAGSTPPGTEPEELTPDETPPPPEPVAVVPATIKLVLTKKGVVWVDGEKIGKLKKKKLELDAGSHEIKVKFGKKIVTTTVELDPDKTYELKIDAKRKKSKLKPL